MNLSPSYAYALTIKTCNHFEPDCIRKTKDCEQNFCRFGLEPFSDLARRASPLISLSEHLSAFPSRWQLQHQHLLQVTFLLQTFPSLPPPGIPNVKCTGLPSDFRILSRSTRMGLSNRRILHQKTIKSQDSLPLDWSCWFDIQRLR